MGCVATTIFVFNEKNGSGEFLFPCYEIQDAGTMKERTVPVPPAAPALSDDGVAPLRELSHRGSHSGGGETPLSV
jgi:hypothetical protein